MTNEQTQAEKLAEEIWKNASADDLIRYYGQKSLIESQIAETINQATAELRAENERLKAEYDQTYTELGHRNETIWDFEAQVAAFQEAVLAYAPHKHSEAEKIEFIRFASTYYSDPLGRGDANNGLLKRLYPLLKETQATADAYTAKIRKESREAAVRECVLLVKSQMYDPKKKHDIDACEWALVEGFEALLPQAETEGGV